MFFDSAFVATWGPPRGEFGQFARTVSFETNSGWFSDRSAAYLASGKPVVLEDTGFSEHLPCGEGLFAVRSREEAVAASRRSKAITPRREAARAVAKEHLEATLVLKEAA